MYNAWNKLWFLFRTCIHLRGIKNGKKLATKFELWLKITKKKRLIHAFYSPLYLCASLICLLMCWTCSNSFTLSMGATAVLDIAADTPPAMKSFMNETGSVSPMLLVRSRSFRSEAWTDLDCWRVEVMTAPVRDSEWRDGRPSAQTSGYIGQVASREGLDLGGTRGNLN